MGTDGSPRWGTQAKARRGRAGGEASHTAQALLACLATRRFGSRGGGCGALAGKRKHQSISADVSSCSIVWPDCEWTPPSTESATKINLWRSSFASALAARKK